MKNIIIFILLFALLTINAMASEIKWARVYVETNATAYAQKDCGHSKAQVIELGLIQGETKIIRWTCGGL